MQTYVQKNGVESRRRRKGIAARHSPPSNGGKFKAVTDAAVGAARKQM